MSWVGRRLPRYEDPVLLRGDGRYTADIAHGARIIRFVRSPLACGRILAIKVPPGTQMVLATDLAGVKPICPRLLRPEYVPIAQPILAAERVTHVGEPIAAVIAQTAAEAEDIAELVEVEIAAETPVVDFDQALAPGAPLVHDNAANNTVRLVTRKPLVLNPSVKMSIDAARLLDTLGRSLDGNHDGQPGGNFSAT